ncbi:Sigma-54 interaction domain-containing protein [Desulfatibacillum alkenivorans DSM 16219]|jgi:DNA-binding NtrC family response regulator|uniref:Sigma-54 interaction domain-containing protein n=1 Tax=Desulfatibacillum alkenivorans DSM 16219 TaxID=1121393 RepID=A0A1M6W6U8_9BACT|nr:sigma 54-interacting transcriptional regulator [Desulfatibacillum alkenivorans]SHK89368.1 Sigma-54 interaction domain-containing protein [Desulfatibacillum alkenivorans DSM 16219]
MGEKARPSVLKADDMNTATKLLGLATTGKPNTQSKPNKSALIAFLSDLETNYETMHFPDDDFTIFPKEYRYLDLDHAGKVYLDILMLLIENGDDVEKSVYSKKALKWLERQIKRYEIVGGVGDTNYRKMAGQMAAVFILTDNYYDFILTYRKHMMRYEKVSRIKKTLGDRQVRVYEKYFWGPFLGAVESKIKQFQDVGLKIFGNNPLLIHNFCLAILYARDDEPCLVVGETGTGKEIIAQMMHVFSPRECNNFVVRNVAGYPDTLFESEIFGVKGGAHTGVAKSRLGVLLKSCGRESLYGYQVTGKDSFSFKPIDGKPTNNPSHEELVPLSGTVFLDEVNSIGFDSQAKLLRAIEQKEIQVLGSEEVYKYRAKVICSANNEGIEGDFRWEGRQDFFFRFKQIVELPPLRSMIDSVPMIADVEVKNLSKKIGFNDDEFSCSKQAVSKLQDYDWPGNFRQMSNVLYRAIRKAELDGRRKIKAKDIEGLRMTDNEMKSLKHFFDDLTWDQLQIKYVDYLLEKFEGNKSRAGRAAGKMSRQFIDTVLKKKANIGKSYDAS